MLLCMLVEHGGYVVVMHSVALFNNGLGILSHKPLILLYIPRMAAIAI